jgi:arylsulfatase A-like enzyme
MRIIGILIGLWLWQVAEGRTGEAGAPNILLILADDLGKYDLSIYGGKQWETPHLDRLARNGAWFEQGYSTAAICSPSRMALLSGQYQQRYGFDFQPHQRYPRGTVQRVVARRLMARDGWVPARQFHLPSRAAARQSGIPAEAHTVAERLQAQGYRTGLFGKWHLGYAPQHHPRQHGFDEFYGFLEAYSLYAPPTSPDVVNAPVQLFADRVQWKKRKGPRAILRNETVIDEPRYLTDAIAEEALEFMQASQGQPFFAMLSFNAPHAPWQAPRHWYDELQHLPHHHLRVYGAMVKALDEAVGRILDYLERQGLAEHTLIAFASDNGIAAYNGHLDPAPHRGAKFSLFEGGINIPLMLSWPGRIAAEQHVGWPASLLDVSATILAAAGDTSRAMLDGRNLLPALTVQEAEIGEIPLFWRSGYNKALRKGRYKAIIDERQRLIWLYDLVADPVEAEDRSGFHQQLLQELRQDLEAWERDLLPPAWPPVIDYQIIIDGQVYYFAV